MRQRACVFSAAKPESSPPHAGASARANASYGSRMDTVCAWMPRLAARSCASVTEWSLEYGPGSSTPCTHSAPSASTHMAAVTDESRPPDNPITTWENPASLTKPRNASTHAS